MKRQRRRRRDQGHLKHRRPHSRRTAGSHALLAIAVDLLLLTFSLVAAVLAQPAMATVAGTAGIGLAAQLARRLMP